MLERASLTILFMLVLCTGVNGVVNGSSDWKPIKAQDMKITAESIGQPDAEAAILLREGVLADEGETGTALRIYIRIKIFRESGRRYADVQLPYRLDLGKISDVHARTVRPDGSVVSVEGRDIFDKLLLTTAHSVWRAKTFSLPSVIPGSIIEYRYRQVYPAGFRYFELDLQSDLFIKELVYKIRPQKVSALDLRWNTFNASDPSRFAPKWEGTYNITATNILPFRREPLSPPERAVKMWGWLYYAQDTETDPEKYWRKYGQDEYEKEIVETRPTKLMRQVLEASSLPDDTVDKKISRIYSYVQSEIRTVTSSETQAPTFNRNKSPEDTIRRRRGTARDINRLFIALLRGAGVDARAAELTTRDENFFHSSFADAIQFDGEVTAVIKPDGAIGFYDPGTPFCPPAMLSWEKEGVEALVLDKDEPKFVETPVAPASENGVARDMKVTVLPDGSLRVDAVKTLTGHRAIDFRDSLGPTSAELPHGNVNQALSQVIQEPAVDDGSIQVKGLDSRWGPIEVSYSFTAPPFAPPTQTRLLLRPGLLGRKDESLFQSSVRTNPVYFEYPWSETDHILINVPDGYASDQLPEDVSLDAGALKYRSTHSLNGNAIVCQRRLEVGGFFFKQSEYATLKSFFDEALQHDRVVLSPKKVNATPSQISGPNPGLF